MGRLLATDRRRQEPAETGQLDESTMVEEGPGTEPGGTSTVGEQADDAGGPAMETVAQEQRELIERDTRDSEAQVDEVSEANQARVSSEFGNARSELSALLTRSAAGVQQFAAAKQAEVSATSGGVMRSAQTLVSATVGSAQAQGNHVRETIRALVDSASASLQGRVQGVAGQISGVIGGLSLPNLPGIAQLRAAAVGLVQRAAGAVAGGLGRVRTIIGSVLQAGMRMLSSLLGKLGQLAHSALSRAADGVQRGVRAVFTLLGRVAKQVLGALSAVISRTVVPMVNRLEGRLRNSLSTARRHAVTAIRTNRAQAMESLATAAGNSGSAGPQAAAQGAAALRAVGQEAVENNRHVVQTFQERTASILGTIFQALTGGAERVVAQISGVVTQATNAAQAKVQEILQGIRSVAKAVSNSLQSMLQGFTSAIAGAVEFVRTTVRRPADALLSFAAGALERATQFAGRFVRNLLSGRLALPTLAEVIGEFRPQLSPGGPITKPRPGPITLPGLRLLFLVLTAVSLLVLYAVPELAVVVSVLIALGLTPATALVVFGALAIVAVIMLLLLLYLLYRLLKSKPPEQPEITHETDFAAPDGSPKTRNDVGVGEKVVFTGTAAGTWTASAGSPTTATGPTFTWTAPERATTVTVTLRVGGRTASAALNVLEPNGIRAIKLAENIYPRGTQGAGMRLDFNFQPLNVSFGNAETREVSGPASDIKGYYLHHGMPHFHNAGAVRFFRINEQNRFAKARDEAAQSDYPAPWDAGSFHWMIPNKFRVITETGDGKEYTQVKQEFTMEGPSGKTTVTKAGEEVERTP